MFFALNPSHKNKVHLYPSDVPALFASTNLSIVVIFPCLTGFGLVFVVFGWRSSMMFDSVMN